ncbi:helix-turn-helix domain-containing protein [Larkinella sp. VNQ87]|uniref:helix-turn-helix domain-containing protein n=1 Tax=Larkinella sp. VNQ87 TaxID=3400921 RepID=UPI003C0D0EBF
MSIGARLQQLIDVLGISVLEFARQLGEKRGEKIYHIIHGRLKPRYETLEKILLTHPNLNADWLLRGEGLMFRTLPQTPLAALTLDDRMRNMEFLLFQLNERVALLQQTNDLLRQELEELVGKEKVISLSYTSRRSDLSAEG